MGLYGARQRSAPLATEFRGSAHRAMSFELRFTMGNHLTVTTGIIHEELFIKHVDE